MNCLKGQYYVEVKDHRYKFILLKKSYYDLDKNQSVSELNIKYRMILK